VEEVDILGYEDTLPTAGTTATGQRLIAHSSCCAALWRARCLAQREEHRLELLEAEERGVPTTKERSSAEEPPAFSFSALGAAAAAASGGSSGNTGSSKAKKSSSSSSKSTNGSSSSSGESPRGWLQAPAVAQDTMEPTEAAVLRAVVTARAAVRTQCLGRDRYGNQYWVAAGDPSTVAVQRHGTWWGLLKGSAALQTLVAALDARAHPSESALLRRLYAATDVWGAGRKLQAWEQRAAAAAAAAEREQAGVHATVEAAKTGVAAASGQPAPPRAEPFVSEADELKQWELVAERRAKWLKDCSSAWKVS
jgi:hypothetical protein